ncbi:MAG: 4'-phosphopantetheinyl transferase superfamily protein [Candidatus Electrothrix sp. AR4]|nr:4'-phosphopantetheinyl transferase superfamily protein [Candidatus Electrothrix sp. AR4]
MAQNIYTFFSSVQYTFGLAIHVRQDHDKVLTLVDLDQVGSALQKEEVYMTRAIFSTEEQIYFKRFKHIKRRNEWLGGRIAVKAAIRIFSDQEQSDLCQLTILPNEYGRPVAEGGIGGQANLSISLSHCDRYAVALAGSGNACGIDLQKISQKLDSLTDHFASDKELALLGRQTADKKYHDTWLTMLWTVKESLKKSTLHDQSVIFSETETKRIIPVREHVYHFSCAVQGRPQAATVYNLSPYILSISQAGTGLLLV